MSQADDPFSASNRQAERSATRKRSEDEQAANRAAAAKRMADKVEAAKRPANSDVGHPWPKPFYR